MTNDNEVAVTGVFYLVTNKLGGPGFSEGEGSGFVALPVSGTQGIPLLTLS